MQDCPGGGADAEHCYACGGGDDPASRGFRGWDRLDGGDTAADFVLQFLERVPHVDGGLETAVRFFSEAVADHAAERRRNGRGLIAHDGGNGGDGGVAVEG